MNKKALILEAIKNSKKELNFLMHHLVKYLQVQKKRKVKKVKRSHLVLTVYQN